MHPSMWRRSLLPILLLHAACEQPLPQNPNLAGDASTVVDAGESGDAGGPGLAGLLIDSAGRPIPETHLLACTATVCYSGESGADGRFAFPIEPPARVALKTHSRPTDVPRQAAAIVPVRLVGRELVDVGTLYVPSLPAGAVIAESPDPQTLPAGDGLELTLRRADVTPTLGEFLYDVAARRIPPEHVPPYPDLGGEQVLAVYALHPFAAVSTSPIAVRAPTELPDGTAVKLRTISELDGTFSDPVPGRAQGGFVSTDPAAGIARLTHLVITR